ncbi:MAG: AAA family ATPase [Saprospiraceae bacterium]|nr:AAA family ATPase [Saprospiraceae bacterium]
MNKIGFKNFRRFIDFPPMEYNGITYLVGRNNSGKSTFVKSLLLILDFLKSGNVNTLTFGQKVLEDANIVTYGRAKNTKAKENLIEFYYQLDNYNILIRISGDNDNTFANVHLIQVIDKVAGLQFEFEPQLNSITISKSLDQNPNEDVEKKSNLLALENEIAQLKKAIEESTFKKSSKEYIELVDTLSVLNKKRNQLAHGTFPMDYENVVEEEQAGYEDKEEAHEAEPQINSYHVSTLYPDGSNMQEIVDFIIEETLLLHGQEYIKSQKGEETIKEFKDYQGIKQDQNDIETSFKKFQEVLFNSWVVYLGANPAKQSALFAIRDKNNALAQSIHEFFQLDINKGSAIYLWVEKWMKEFEVGDTFEIIIHAGEAYEVNVFSHDTKIPLADKGMGSIQAMLLILRLAIVIHKFELMKKLNEATKAFTTIFLVIEEPELNLHPRLQNRLTDLFLEAKEGYQLNFIIETHSEYIIRRSQVLVKENEYEVSPNENPFYVYYFPKDDVPYRMEYEENGRFNRNFGEGFFEVATNSTMTLLKPKTQK